MAIPNDKSAKHLGSEANWMRCAASPATWAPHVDMMMFEERLEICFELSGVVESDIHIEASAYELRIWGQRACPALSQQNPQKILQMEINRSAFAKRLRLPVAIAPTGIQTSYINGIFWVVVPLVDS